MQLSLISGYTTDIRTVSSDLQNILLVPPRHTLESIMNDLTVCNDDEFKTFFGLRHSVKSQKLLTPELICSFRLFRYVYRTTPIIFDVGIPTMRSCTVSTILAPVQQLALFQIVSRGLGRKTIANDPK